MIEVPLTRGCVARIDDEDAERVMAFKWRASCGTPEEPKYAVRSSRAHEGKRRTICLHRFLLDAKPGEEVDHINGDTFDNRRSNLRLCSDAENARNRRKGHGTTSRYKGVYWHRGGRKWAAVIMDARKNYHLGYFVDERLAAMAYDRAATARFGAFALLNFPETTTP